jgi:formyltetrahydrofolate synthetase
MIEYFQSKGMLRTFKSLGMELVQAENPIIQILALKNDFETMKDLLSQIVIVMSRLNSIIRNQIYQANTPI